MNQSVIRYTKKMVIPRRQSIGSSSPSLLLIIAILIKYESLCRWYHYYFQLFHQLGEFIHCSDGDIPPQIRVCPAGGRGHDQDVGAEDT